MADDLGDEWWLVENTENRETNVQNKTVANQDTYPPAKNSKKRKITEPNTKEQTKEADLSKSTEKTKKKRKRKPTEKIIEKTISGNDTVQIFWSSFYKSVEGKLCSLELEDLRVQDEMFFTESSVHTGDLKELSPYLNTVFPRWSKLVEKCNRKDLKASPVLLLVTSAATRATDLVRACIDFRQNGKVVKLFSKHIKLEEQEKYLQDHVVHLGVGTPNRIYKLIQSGSLKLSCLKSVVLDWTWRDAKLRRLMDIPEIQQDLITLLKEVILIKAREQKVKIGLF